MISTRILVRLVIVFFVSIIISGCALMNDLLTEKTEEDAKLYHFNQKSTGTQSVTPAAGPGFERDYGNVPGW